MKRKFLFISRMKKSDTGLTENTEENFSEKQSVEDITEISRKSQGNQQNVENEQNEWKSVTNEQLVAAINELGPDQNKLDQEP